MRLACVAEQITDLPVPQFLGERVQNRTPEHGVPVPQIVEERVQNRTLEQTAEFPVPRIMEAVVEVVPCSPQESVQNCVGEQIADSLCLGSWRQLGRFCLLHHRSACLTVRRSRLWVSLCLGSWRPP